MERCVYHPIQNTGYQLRAAVSEFISECEFRLTGKFADKEALRAQIHLAKEQDQSFVSVPEPDEPYWTGILVGMFRDGKAEVFHTKDDLKIQRTELLTETVIRESMNPYGGDPDRFTLYKTPQGRKLFEVFEQFVAPNPDKGDRPASI